MAVSRTGGRPNDSNTMRSLSPALSRQLAPGQVHHHVLGEALFREALVRERKRADRFSEPFAVLLVDRGERPPETYPWAPILRAAAAKRRDIDVIGWLEQGAVLGMLIPRTNDGSHPFDVMRHLQRELVTWLGDRALAVASTRLYGHGTQATPDGVALPSVDLLLEGFVEPPVNRWREAAKRGLDIVGSLGLLALFSPALLAICAAVKWTSPGPALFKQTRIGRNGRPFTMLKFRSMHVDVGHKLHQEYVTWFIKASDQQKRSGDEVFKLQNDPRVTRVGRFIRRTSLDELPQFWNVLRGDMSLVGPRPPLPFEVEQYQSWHRRRVLDAKPGVTGLWQVNGRSRTTFDEMVRLDLRYARTHSLWMDIKILAATPRAMISGKGAL